jgi:hypothetical protein
MKHIRGTINNPVHQASLKLGLPNSTVHDVFISIQFNSTCIAQETKTACLQTLAVSEDNMQRLGLAKTVWFQDAFLH